MKVFLTVLTLFLTLGIGFEGKSLAQQGSEEHRSITLLRPTVSGGMPLLEAINARRSDREFKKENLTEQQIANLLWVAVGVNRAEEGNRRTTPTAMNKQDVSVYALNDSGAFHYDAIDHRLNIVELGDKTSVLNAPFSLIFVAPANNENAGLNVGFCSQNVYLYAASEGLNTVAKGTADRPALKKLLKLSDDQQIVLVQPVGPRP